MDNVNGNLVYPVIIIAVFGEVSLYFVVNYDAVFITNGLYFGIFDGRQGICNNRQAGNTGCKTSGLPCDREEPSADVRSSICHAYSG